MVKETGFYDRRGIPIHVGDLIRVFHFVHRLRREKMYMYFRVVTVGGGRPAIKEWCDDRAGTYQCCLEAVSGEIDVIAESNEYLHRNERGEIITFNERRRVTT